MTGNGYLIQKKKALHLRIVKPEITEHVPATMRGHFKEEATEEYVETIYEFWEKDAQAPVRTNELASELKVAAATVTGMIKRLSELGYVDYERYRGVKLTEKGLRLGRQMKRRHRLAECLLINMLGFRGDAHEAACRLEHAIDDSLEFTLAAVLGDPKVDPSGLPIPPADPDLAPEFMHEAQRIIRLSDLEPGMSGVICAFLCKHAEALSAIGLRVGTDVEGKEGMVSINGEGVEMDDTLTNQVLITV